MTDTAGRTQMLAAIRHALRDVPADESPADVPVARTYRQAGPRALDELVARFAERVADYRAEVVRTSSGSVRSVLTDVFREHGAGQVVVPKGLPDDWRPDGIELLQDDGLGIDELDAADGVLTGCVAAIAETGTIVLNGGPGQGRRAITLLPDLHVCVVEATRIVASVPEGLRQAFDAGSGGPGPITLISGPSATSDIELRRVEGVHGPHRLHVVLVEDGGSALGHS